MNIYSSSLAFFASASLFLTPSAKGMRKVVSESNFKKKLSALEKQLNKQELIINITLFYSKNEQLKDAINQFEKLEKQINSLPQICTTKPENYLPKKEVKELRKNKRKNKIKVFIGSLLSHSLTYNSATFNIAGTKTKRGKALKNRLAKTQHTASGSTKYQQNLKQIQENGHRFPYDCIILTRTSL